ncbi:MAG TPA: hypothetical protein EYH34_05675, partial [Planctomycetes bacterium]|nr:hypothetical protein [Planctomycetota bacterium]
MFCADSISRSVRRLRKTCHRRRKGTVLVLSALLMLVLMAMLACSVDLGYMYAIKAELSRAVDAAALAGAGSLVDGSQVAQLRAADFMLRNRVGSQVLLEEQDRDTLLEAWLAEHVNDFEVQVGHWDTQARVFTQSDYLPSAVRVSARYSNAPFFFARVLGFQDFDIQAEAIARYQPRDIVLVLDFSASMNDDSELRRIYKYGESARATVEASLLEIWQDLGSPTYGNMEFQPQYVSSTNNQTI